MARIVYTDTQLMRLGLEAAGAGTGVPPKLRPTGLAPIDELIGGLGPGDVMVVGAATSVGKSLTATHMVSQSTNGLYVSLEDSARLIAGRLIARHTGRSPSDLRINGWSWGRETLARVPTEAPPTMRVAAMPGATIDEVLEMLDTAHTTSPLDIVAVDYLTALGMPATDDRRHGYIAAMGALRAWAVNHRIPVIICAQLRRQPPGEVVEPKLSWFQETSSLEQKADLALLLWHDKAGPHRRTYGRLAKSKYSQLSEPFEIVIQHGVITGTAPAVDEEI